MTEGNSGTVNATFTVTLSAASGKTVTVNYATADGTATAPGDYTAIANTPLTFNPGDTSKTVTVLVTGDAIDEVNETFTVNLANPSNATIGTGTGTGTITDDDGPSISINDVTVTEGDSGQANAVFTVSLSAASPQTITVNYATANGTAAAGSDYAAIASTALTFNPGDTTKQISVVVNGDTADEADETFLVNLSSPVNATIADGQGQGTILNDDTPPTVAFNAASSSGSESTTLLICLFPSQQLRARQSPCSTRLLAERRPAAAPITLWPAER